MERAKELLDVELRAMGEVQLAEQMRHMTATFMASYMEGGSAFAARYPDSQALKDRDEEAYKNRAATIMPDTARRAYRKDINNGRGPFCPDDDDIIVAATLIEQALHFPDVDINKVIARANRGARIVLGIWSPNTSIPDTWERGIDLDAVTALASAIEGKLPNLAALMKDSIARLRAR